MGHAAGILPKAGEGLEGLSREEGKHAVQVKSNVPRCGTCF
jgi:hypothetical protein